ncbi:numb-like protein [Sipha flava]|uniref:Numb-like protein n=1 Tax=Sipha flava TaxID=143950 RepID=A0A2S2PXP9_9HEMI|nr:numb-like protein [Sipha flava]
MSYYCRRPFQDAIDNSINRWPQDEIGILDGNCSFDIDYLGNVEVSDPSNSKICHASFVKLYQKYMTDVCFSNPALLWITGYELRIVEKKSKNLILAQIIENIVFCASAIDNQDQFFYTCRDTYNNRWLCHLFVVNKQLSSNRLCRAVGFAFRVCLKRKTIREGLTSNNTRSIG